MKVVTRILQVIDFLLVPFCILTSMFSMFAFDSPYAEADMGTMGWLALFIWSTLPIVVDVFLIFSILNSKPEKYKKSFWLSLIPLIYVGLFITVCVVLGIIGNLAFNAGTK
jgi:hypothetical protein